jgi:predicted aspartyl protease
MFLFFVLMGFLRLTAQERFGEPDAKLLSTIPFKVLSGGVVIIRGQVNQYEDTMNFILDTGSGGISLDSLTCVRIGIPLAESDRTIRGIGGIRKVKFLNNATLKLKGLRVDSLNFHVNDYEILTTVYGIKIDGIIGYSFLNRYIVRLDYDSLRMDVFSQGDYKYKRGGFTIKPILNSIPIQPIKFKDAKKFQNKFYFDTGAGLCFLLSEEYVRDSSVMQKSKPAPLVTQAEGLGGKMEMRLTTVKEIQVGQYRFKNVPTYIFDDKYNVTSYPFLGGLIGNDILRRFNATLNYQKREINLIPNGHFNDAFDYAYTGLGVYFVDNKVQIEDVVKDSPGEKSGLLPGDVILSINDNYSNDIQVYKQLMQTPGEKLRFLILRNGERYVLYMKPKSILKD